MRPGTSTGGNNPDSTSDAQYMSQQRYNDPEAAMMSGSRSSMGVPTSASTSPYGGLNDEGGYMTATTAGRRESDFGTDDDFGGSLMESGLGGGSGSGGGLVENPDSAYDGRDLESPEVMGEGSGRGSVSEGGTQGMLRMKSEGEGSEMTPMWSETKTKAGKERKRLPLACIMCRRKKIRCSGEKPACKHCVRSRIPCVYKQTARKTTPRTDYMAMLDRRLKRMEERLLKNVPKEEVPAMLANTGRSVVRPSVTTSSKKRAAESAFIDEGGPSGWNQFGPSKRRVSSQPGLAPHEHFPGQPGSSHQVSYKEWLETYPTGTGLSGEELAALQYLGSHTSGVAPSSETQTDEEEHEGQTPATEFFSKMSQQQPYSRQPSRSMSISQQQHAYLQQEHVNSPDMHRSPTSMHHTHSPASMHHAQSPIGPPTTTSMHNSPSPALQSHHLQQHLISSPPKLDTRTAAALSQAHLQSSPYYTVSHAQLPSPMSARSFPAHHYQPPPPPPPSALDQPNPSQYLYPQPAAQPDLCDWHRNVPTSATSTNNKCVVCAFIISGLLNRTHTF